MDKIDRESPPEIFAGYAEYRADLAHYWARLMWYRDELWRITTPVWTAYGVFLASCIGYVWPSDKGKLSGQMALMLIIVIVTFSWVIQRLYWTYAHRVYDAITAINKEVQERERYLYTHFLKHEMRSDYGRFRVYPELNMIFSIVGLALMFACIFTVAAAVGFDFMPVDIPGFSAVSMIQICVNLIFIFEFALLKLKKYCEVCGESVTEQPGNLFRAAQAEQQKP